MKPPRTFIPLGELLASPPDLSQISRRWKHVKLQLPSLVIEIFDPQYGTLAYWIDLETCQDSAEILDWIFQLLEKDWVTPDMLHEVLQAIDVATEQVHGGSVQGVFCPWGKHQKKRSWKAAVKRRKAGGCKSKEGGSHE